MIEIPIVLIGHKDHGKSTLIGRLLLDTKSVKESRLRDVQEADKAWGRKFELAHLVDSFKEEREREMTMDTTRAFLKGKKRNYQLIDVPGHEELISNMLTGASGAQVALLVVSIEEGVKEQTRQHLQIAKLLGIEQLGVMVNKIDKVNYQENAFNEVKKELKKILNRIGYLAENIRFFPISAFAGDNVVKKSQKIPWYQGPTVLEFLENEIEIPESLESLPLRFLVQDIYVKENVLVGKIESGKLERGQKILFLPENKKYIVNSIRDSEKELERAFFGQNIGIGLQGRIEMNRGSVGSLPDSPPQMSDILSGEVFWIKKPSQRELVLECGTNQIEGELQTPENINPREKSFYKIQLKKPIVFDSESKTILGKIVLKDRGQIIGVGNTKTC